MVEDLIRNKTISFIHLKHLEKKSGFFSSTKDKNGNLLILRALEKQTGNIWNRTDPAPCGWRSDDKRNNIFYTYTQISTVKVLCGWISDNKQNNILYTYIHLKQDVYTFRCIYLYAIGKKSGFFLIQNLKW